MLLLAVLPFLWSLGKNESVMGDRAIKGIEKAVSGAALVLIAASIVALGYLTIA